jgi:hypothetical protein
VSRETVARESSAIKKVTCSGQLARKLIMCPGVWRELDHVLLTGMAHILADDGI